MCVCYSCSLCEDVACIVTRVLCVRTLCVCYTCSLYEDLVCISHIFSV